MDSTLLRMILLAVGVAFLAGIYFWDTRRRRNGAAQAKPRQTPEISDTPQVAAQSQTEREWDRQAELDELESELPQLSVAEPEETLDDEPVILNDETPEIVPEPLGEQQELFGFSAREESPVDVPTKIIQINLMAKSGPFSGPAILAAVKETGLQVGEMDIYHRYANDGSGKSLFSMASMVEPGVFPLKAMEGFSTPGLTLFCQLPGPGDSLAIFSDMLFTAERLAANLGGELQDETHSALTKQTVEHIRSQIMEHRRLVQLARSKR